MDNEDDLSDIEYAEMIRHRAARRAHAIVMSEAAALVASAQELDEDAIAADSQLLAIAIAQAIVDAYVGDIPGDEREDPRGQVPS